MKKYNVVLTSEAEKDIDSYIEHILFEIKSPLTALSNYEGLFNEINKLSKTAGAIALDCKKEYLQFGFNVKHTNYKKMTIIFIVQNETAYIKRIIAQKLISGL